MISAAGIDALGHHGGGNHTAHANDGSNRQIDVARNQDVRLTDADNQGRSDLPQQVAHVLAGEERRVHRAEHQAQDD